MSGIYNQPSIYKQGGGGSGGYSDGGALVDGDFIKVENNSISTYTNTSRSDINYYFEIQDGEVLNAVIELTNEYNATVHVYILQNGFYIPLGNVGGDTVNAGDDYKINIVGNSFMLEVVTPMQYVPEYADINGQKIKVVGFGDYLITVDLGQWYTENEIIEFVSNSGGWDLLTHSQWDGIYSYFGNNALRSTSGWNNTQGTNTSGLNFYPFGTKVENDIYDAGVYSYFWKKNDGFGNCAWIKEGTHSETTFGTYNKARGRIIKKYKNL